MQNPPHDAKVLLGHCYAFAKSSRMVFSIAKVVARTLISGKEPMILDKIIWSLDMVEFGRKFPRLQNSQTVCKE